MVKELDRTLLWQLSRLKAPGCPPEDVLESTLGDFLDGKGSPEERQSLEAHLRACPSCINRLIDLQELARLEKEGEEPPRALVNELKRLVPSHPNGSVPVLERVTETISGIWAAARKWQIPRFVGEVVVASAVAVFILFLGPTFLRKADTTATVKKLQAEGLRYEQASRLEAAIEKYQTALALAQGVQDTPIIAVLSTRLGGTYTELGRWQDAVEAYERAIHIKPDDAEAYNGLGEAYDKLGYYQEAEKAYKEALRLKPDFADAYYNLGGVLRVLGRFEEALGVYQQQREEARRRNNAGLEEGALINLAEMFDELGDANNALAYSRQAELLYKQIGKPSGKAEVLEDIGRLHEILGQNDKSHYDKALDFYQQALSKYRETKDQRGIGEMLVRIGEVHIWSGQYEQALSQLKEALQVHQQSSGSRAFLGERGEDLYFLGLAYSRLGQYNEAFKTFQQAETIARRLNRPYDRYEILARMGEVQEKQGGFQEALVLYTQAIEALEKVSHRQQLEELKVPLQEEAFPVYQNTVRLLFNLHTQRPDEHYIEQAFLYHEKGKARTLLDLLEEAKVHVREGIDPALLKEEEQIKARISGIHQVLANRELSKEQEKPLRTTLDEQEQALQVLQVKMALANPKYAELTSPQIASIQQVQTVLDKETLLLEYALGAEKSFLWGVTQDGMQAYELPTTEEEVSRQIEPYLPTLEKPLYEKKEIEQRIELGKGLYRTLLQPAAAQLQGKSKLIIVPDGSLYSLPFETLITDGGESNGEKNQEQPQLQSLPYLVKDYTVTYTPSASVLVTLEKNRRQHQQEKASPQAPLLAFGDPLYEATPVPRTIAARGACEEGGGEFSPLPHSAEEVEKIAEVYGIALSSDAVNLRERATKRHLQEMDLTRYRILHFATHAVVCDQVRWITQPALVLSLVGTNNTYDDGFLLMEEIFNLRLNADLVVLSACNTGGGKLYRGEGIVGLTRAFMYTGTPSVVASLWQVNDQSTSLFMEFFYRNLKDGQSKAEALQQAKKQLMQTPDFAAPYFWAPFILIGSGN